MTVAHVYRITFKQGNCTATIKQDEITHTMNKKLRYREEHSASVRRA